MTHAYSVVEKVRSRPDVKLLFIISDDYGELSNTMYFLHGNEFALRSTLLLPQRIFDTNKNSVPGSAVLYTSLEGILRTIDDQKPDIVFLFSGYLYAVNGLLPIEAVATIVRILRARGIAIATSDPFIGALGDPKSAARLRTIHPSFPVAYELLKDSTHFYPCPCEHISDKIQQVSAFNSRYLRQEYDGTEIAEFLSQHDANPASPYWLFVLSSLDYSLQTLRHGRSTFIGYLTSMMIDAAKKGKQPIFIGPPECVLEITKSVGSPSQIEPAARGMILKSFCPHELFAALLVLAEYVFYWNMFSNSIVIRLGNGLPTFFFDHGHLAFAGNWMYQRAVQNYFRGWKPLCLDQAKEIDASVLTIVDTVFRRDIDRVRQHFQSAPSPEQTIADILNNRGTATPPLVKSSIDLRYSSPS